MFDYYGSKNYLAKYYQSPRHGLIIEPFAGSAGYSMYHLRRNPSLKAILVEKSPKVFGAWKFLKEATVEDIDGYRIPEVGEKTSDFFAMASSASNAFLGCSSMTMNARMRLSMEIEMRRIRGLVHLMPRIEVVNASYEDIGNEVATWFVDPPYQSSDKSIRGMGYDKGCRSEGIDFKALGEWCLCRNGQTIVCEQEGADWLPFRPFFNTHNSQDRKYTEVVWTSEHDEQMDFFGFDHN